MRKAVYESTHAEGLALFARAPVVHLATTGDAGQPILRALHAVVVDDLILFHGAPVGEKTEGVGRAAVLGAHEVVAEIPSWYLDPVRACPATTYFVSAQAEGTLFEVEDRETKARALAELMTKYQPGGGYKEIRGDDPLYRKAIDGLLIAGLRTDRLVCKAKLGQNRRLEERRRIVKLLAEHGRPDAAAYLTDRFPELK